MQLFDPNNPNERKKMIAAAVLAVGAIIVLGYVFFGGSSKKPPTNSTAAKPSPTPTRVVKEQEAPVDDPSIFRPIVFTGTVPPVSEANRNIFAYYEPPPPPVKVPYVPTPSPTPTPPMAISSLSPSTVYARTADFSLEITGDKFAPAVRVTVDGRELPTRFISAQQLFTTVPAALIANPGVRQVMARTGDGKLYSNSATLNVTPPPLPNYNFVGIIGKPRGNDTAVLQDKGNKELLNVQRGDVLGGRFRVNSISEREVVLVDTTLKIRHTVPFTVDNSVNPQSRPPVRRVDSEEP
ncbi:MAG TPA: IPT/TIG domain-containing protein [Pyrinomonadaceae bacterium]|nr:IPT/TIG domain-containing protein [Pyrinomonadaceae bacterium]